MQQEILVYVREQVDAQFQLFRSAADEGLEEARKALKDEEDIVNADIVCASISLESLLTLTFCS